MIGEGYCFFSKVTRKSNNSSLFVCASSEDTQHGFSSNPDHGSQSMIYRPLLESKIILNTIELLCEFPYAVFY